MSTPELAGPAHLEGLREATNRRLAELAPSEDIPPVELHRAMRQALLSPGKRIRPIVTMLSAEACGGDFEVALDPACALEMVHTASLVLDDLPSMDDARLRRGRPTTHVTWGSDIATLAAVTLLNDAYGVLARTEDIAESTRLQLVDLLSRTIGDDGVVAGQVQDLGIAANGSAELLELQGMASRKTGALFVAAAEMGARAAGARPADLGAFRAFARDLGLCFQILDDLADSSGTEESLGKDAGQDADRPSFVSVLGPRRTREAAERIAQRAVRALEPLGDRARPLAELAHHVRQSATGLAFPL